MTSKPTDLTCVSGQYIHNFIFLKFAIQKSFKSEL